MERYKAMLFISVVSFTVARVAVPYMASVFEALHWVYVK